MLTFDKEQNVVYGLKDKSDLIASDIVNIINSKSSNGLKTVIGLSYNKNIHFIYDALILMYKKHKVTFNNVFIFNLTDFYPIKTNDLYSHYNYIYKNFVNCVDIPLDNFYTFGCDNNISNIDINCVKYDNKIDSLGGFDIVLTDIDLYNNIVCFNDDIDKNIDSVTRIIKLNEATQCYIFNNYLYKDIIFDKIVTVGLSKIMNAKLIIALSNGIDNNTKINNIYQHINYLTSKHNNIFFYINNISYNKINIINSFNLKNRYNNTDKSIIELSFKLKKSILQLTQDDYKNNNLSYCLEKNKDLKTINTKIYNNISNTITDYPGKHNNTRNYNKNIIIFSPHPDDDIISMGGTMIKLHNQGYDVHVVYQTSGNIAVSDSKVLKYIDFINDYHKLLNIKNYKIDSLYLTINDFLKSKKYSLDKDSILVRRIKGLIRRNEAKETCKYIGIDVKNLHFLDMPFYETGNIIKNKLKNEDINLLIDIIKKINPIQIYAAGDWLDPHGTHKTCFSAIMTAVNCLKSFNKYIIWLYRGAWDEWHINDIDMAVPINNNELLIKKQGILKHESQRDEVLFKGNDKREFWLRSQDRNKKTAKLYNKLGFIQLNAVEAFAQYHY